MATFWERMNEARRAAVAAFAGSYSDPMATSNPAGLYHGIDDRNRERIERYKQYWKYYNGQHREHLKRRNGPNGPGPDDNTIVNISRRVVNKGIGFLFGEPLAWELPDDLDGESSAGTKSDVEQLLDDIWTSEDRRLVFLNEVGQNGFVVGDFFIQLVPANPAIPGSLPSFVNVDPAMIFPTHNPDNIDEVWAFEQRWLGRGGLPTRMIHALDEDRPGLWVTWTEQYFKGDWTVTVEQEPWPWPWPMYVHGKNWPNANSFWGISDLEDADLNDAINSVASNLRRITRIYAHPVPWARGFGKGDLPLDGSKFATATDPNATMGVLEMANELKSSFDYLQFLRTAFSEVTQVPENDPDRMTIGAQSGFALQVLFDDLMSKTKIKRALYGQAIVTMNEHLLEMAGAGPDQQVVLHWGNPLPKNANDQNAVDGFDLGSDLASHETVATRRGLDWEQEQERIAEESLDKQSIGALALANFDAGMGPGGQGPGPVGGERTPDSVPPGVVAAVTGTTAATT